MKNLYLIRGVSGAGKSQFANSICHNVCSADDYFTDDSGNYNFNGSYLSHAHSECQSRVSQVMRTGCDVAVANTFTRKWEMKPYYDLAKEYSYTVYSLVVENRHNGVNQHNVLEEILQKQESRFEIKLR